MSRLVSSSRLAFYSIMLAVSINILFGFVRLINLLSIRFNYFYSPKVIDIVIFSSSTDPWIWGASLLFIISAIFLIKTLYHLDFPRWLSLPYFLLLASLLVFLIDDRTASVFAVPLGFMVVGSSIHFGKGFLHAKTEQAALLTSIGVISLLIPLELASLSSWILNAFNYQVPFGYGLRWRFPWVDLQLFNVLYPLIPLLFLILLYSWVWIPALRYVLSRIGRGVNSGIQRIEKLNKRSLVLGLILSLAASIFISYYSYIHLPDSALVGVDSMSYYGWLKEMTQKGPYSALETDRPLFNLLMYSVKYVTGLSPQAIVRIMPTIGAVCLSLAVFWFVKVGTNDERLALMSSLFSSFSFQTTVSIFTYSLANWFAMIESFLLFAFLLKSSKKHPWRYVSISTLIGIALLLTHPYTWNVLIIILFAYLAWTFLRKSEEKSEIAPITVLLTANLLFYIFYTLTPFGKGLSHGEGTMLHTLGISNLFNLQNGLAVMVSMKVGGLFGNPLMIILAVAGIFSMINFTRSLPKFHRMLLLWVIVPSLALLAIPPGQESLYYRVIYLIPFQILAAIGLCWILNKLKDIEHKFKLNRTYSYILRASLFTLVVLFLLNYALRSVDEAVIYSNLTP